LFDKQEKTSDKKNFNSIKQKTMKTKKIKTICNGLVGVGIMLSIQGVQGQEGQPASKQATPQTVVAQPATQKPAATPAAGPSAADREKMAAERKANQETMLKIAQLNKEVQEAEKNGDGQKPEVVAKKAELKKLQDERNAKMKAEREKMMKERQASMPPQDPEEMKKMAQLNKEIQEANKKGEGDTPETKAKKEELKKMQEARVAKVKAEREKMMKEQSVAPASTPAK
jgi:hypothetical protein